MSINFNPIRFNRMPMPGGFSVEGSGFPTGGGGGKSAFNVESVLLSQAFRPTRLAMLVHGNTKTIDYIRSALSLDQHLPSIAAIKGDILGMNSEQVLSKAEQIFRGYFDETNQKFNFNLEKPPDLRDFFEFGAPGNVRPDQFLAEASTSSFGFYEISRTFNKPLDDSKLKLIEDRYRKMLILIRALELQSFDALKATRNALRVQLNDLVRDDVTISPDNFLMGAGDEDVIRLGWLLQYLHAQMGIDLQGKTIVIESEIRRSTGMIAMVYKDQVLVYLKALSDLGIPPKLEEKHILIYRP